MIKIQNLCMKFPNFNLQDINLSINNGEFFMLLGPTGAGKTLVLEAIAGIAPIDSGRILLGKKDITRLSPEQRGIGIVYQDYALFPHLSVLENITYGLRYHKTDSQASSKWVKRLMEHLGLHPLSHRPTLNLSGGEQQRIALARALAVNPSVLLLDEPLSALDPNFREDIQDMLKKLHKEIGVTFLMVTHDFSEALFLGDRLAILNNGNIEQAGPVAEVFQRPTTPFVAEFVGMKNVFPATFTNTKAMVDDLELRLKFPSERDKGYVAIRAEDILIGKKPISGNGMNVFQGKLISVTDRGLYHEVALRIAKINFKAMLTKTALFEINLHERKNVHIGIRPSAIHVF